MKKKKKRRRKIFEQQDSCSYVWFGDTEDERMRG